MTVRIRAGAPAGPPAALTGAHPALLPALLLALLSGCMPWAAAETARTLEPGQLRGGAALSAIAPPGQPDRPLPVPQAWVGLGVGERSDVRLDYALPLTFQARFKRQLTGRAPTIAASAGAGLHGVPGFGISGTSLWTPFATATLYASGFRPEPEEGQEGEPGAPARDRGPYGAVGMLVPFVLDEGGAATLWVVPRGGWSAGRGRFGWGVELGAVIPTMHAGDSQVLGAVWGAWSPSLP